MLNAESGRKLATLRMTLKTPGEYTLENITHRTYGHRHNVYFVLPYPLVCPALWVATRILEKLSQSLYSILPVHSSIIVLSDVAGLLRIEYVIEISVLYIHRSICVENTMAKQHILH